MEHQVTSVKEESPGPSEPHWLKPFLDAEFFGPCLCVSKRSQNCYCIDCSAALCNSCCAEKHGDHRAFQVRRSSYKNVVRIADISKFMDTSGIQHYVINDSQVAFLHSRPPKARTTTSFSPCIICRRPLLPKRSYCSIGCKFAWVLTTRGDSRLALQPKEDSCTSSTTDEIGFKVHLRRRLATRKNTLAAAPEEEKPVKTTSTRRRLECCKLVNRRKGIPHRAPQGGVYSIF